MNISGIIGSIMLVIAVIGMYWIIKGVQSTFDLVVFAIPFGIWLGVGLCGLALILSGMSKEETK